MAHSIASIKLSYYLIHQNQPGSFAYNPVYMFRGYDPPHTVHCYLLWLVWVQYPNPDHTCCQLVTFSFQMHGTQDADPAQPALGQINKQLCLQIYQHGRDQSTDDSIQQKLLTQSVWYSKMHLIKVLMINHYEKSQNSSLILSTLFQNPALPLQPTKPPLQIFSRSQHKQI